MKPMTRIATNSVTETFQTVCDVNHSTRLHLSNNCSPEPWRVGSPNNIFSHIRSGICPCSVQPTLTTNISFPSLCLSGKITSQKDVSESGQTKPKPSASRRKPCGFLLQSASAFTCQAWHLVAMSGMSTHSDFWTSVDRIYIQFCPVYCNLSGTKESRTSSSRFYAALSVFNDL